MSEQDSSKPARSASTGKRAKKERPKVKKGFPLTWHPSGSWCKRVNGKLFYFGSDPDKALERWVDAKDDLRAGKRPREAKQEAGSATLAYALNAYCDHIARKVEAGERSPRWFEDVRCVSSMVLDCLGRDWAVEGLEPADFRRLRDRLALTTARRKKKSGKRTATQTVRRTTHNTLHARIIRVRGAFNWMLKAGIIERQPRYGTAFDPPDYQTRENERLAKGPKMLTRAEVRSLLRTAKPKPALYAAILLGVNVGAQNVDIESLRWCDVDLAGGWYIQPRSKKAKPRRAKLWARTVRAIKGLAEGRETEPADLVFQAKRGGAWRGRNCLAKEFKQLLKEAGIVRDRCGYQWLRHTFITQASQLGDLIAVQLAVGHADRTITRLYIHDVYDPRLIKISESVENWLVKK